MAEELLEELSDLKQSAVFYINRSNAYRFIDQGNKLFNSAIYDEDSIEMDLIYEALDRYREALMLTNCFKESSENTDIELEAICCSKLGTIFYNIFKNNDKSEFFVKQSVTLGMSLYPKNVALEEWYVKSADILQAIRKKREDEEVKINNEIREKIKSENPKIFEDLLKEFNTKSTEGFISYVIEKHPPSEGYKLNAEEEVKKIGLKKLLIKLIALYHPDKVIESDLKRKVILDEICKYLNSKYNYLKM